MSPAPVRLQGLVAAVRAHLTRRVLVAAVLWWVAAAAWVLVAAWLAAGPGGWRQGSPGPVVLDAALLGLLVGGGVLLRRGIRRWLAEARLSHAMERAAGLHAGLVLGSLELTRSVPPGVSAALAARAAERTVAELSRPVRALTGPLGSAVSRWTRRGSGAAAVMAVVLTALALATPARAGRAWSGLSRPLAVAATPVLAPVRVTPGNVEVPRGSDVDVRVEAPGRASVEVAWQAAGDVARTETVTLVDGVGTKRYGGVSATIVYRVRTPDGVTTEAYRITPVDPLFVSDLQVTVTYPSHTGLPPDELHGTVPPLRLPEGTRLAISGRTSRPLSTAALIDSAGSTVVALDVKGASFEGAWRPDGGGRFPWSFQDAQGAPAALLPDPLDIELVPDSAPTVAIPLPGMDTVMPLGQRQPLIIEARDDYGLSRLELVAYRVTAGGERQEPLTMGIDMAGTRAAMARPLLNMSDWGLVPGDHVRYFARAIDNAPRPHATESREYVLRVPDPSELRRNAQDQLDSMASRLEQLTDQADKSAQANKDHQERTAAGQQTGDRPRAGSDAQKDQADFQEREDLKKAVEGQQALSGQVDSMRAELADLQKTMEQAGQADPALTKDLQELQKLMQQVDDDSMKQRLQELSGSLDKADMKQANQSLKDLAAEQEKFRDRLDESLDRFRRAAAQQDFRATRSDAEELARQERALADAMKEGDQPAKRAQQQKALEEKTGALGDRMDKLAQRLDQLKEQQASEAVKGAKEQASQAGRQMSQAGQRAQEKRGNEASDQAEQAAKSLDAAAKRLDQAQRQMAEQKADAAQGALRQATDDALALARRQAEIRQQMQGASREQMTAMRADEGAVLQGMRNLAQGLMEGTQGAVQGSREFSEQIGRAMQSVQRTVDAMDQRAPSPAPGVAAERVVDDLNQLALLAMASSAQLAQEAQSGQGQQDAQEQVEKLAQQQGDLVNKTNQLTPMQLGAQALAEQLKKLGEEQRKLADQLSDVKDEPGAKDKPLGDLDALAKEAAALAQQMAQGRLTPDMMKRQEKLFHRLLDAGRSLENDDEISDERESKTAGAFKHNDVQPLSADQLGVLRYGLPDAEQLQRLPPAVRQLVIQYFERLNRGGDSATRGGGHGR
jgi:hypothetical protein